MKRNLTFLILLQLFAGLAFSQFSEKSTVTWKVCDQSVSEKFISEYMRVYDSLDVCNYEKIQTTDELRVQVKVGAKMSYVIQVFDKTTGRKCPLMQEFLNMMKKEVTKLLKREYEWCELERGKFGTFEGEDVINVFNEINYKFCRDNFWWTYRRIHISPGRSMVLRAKNFPLGLSVSWGREDLGFPSSAMGTMDFAIINEVVQAFASVPIKYYKIGNFSPLLGSIGGGVKFDGSNFGGSAFYQSLNSAKSDGEFSQMNDTSFRSRLFINWAGTIYYSQTFSLGGEEEEKKVVLPQETSTQKKKGKTSLSTKSTEPIEEEESNGGFFKPMSMRVKVGVGYTRLSYVQANWDTVDKTFKYHDSSSIRANDWQKEFQFLLRFELVSDPELSSVDRSKNYNKYSLSFQTNYALNGMAGFQAAVSYSFTPWLSLNVLGVYYVTGVEILKTKNEPLLLNKYSWEPGYMIVPTITLQF